MNARRSSGRADSTASSWPWPTITCISRPMPESDSNSWMSSNRHDEPLISYSPAPSRNIRRVIDTSE